MELFLQVIFALAILGLIFYYFFRPRKKILRHKPLPEEYRTLLQTEVPFYQQLQEEKKTEFETRMQHFLSTTRITGINIEVEPLDRVLIASSALIPIFNFPGWEYVNLREVLLYPDSFDDEFRQQGHGRSILGMVGTGAMNNMMILSQHQLRQAFLNKTGKDNTAIHEFVHLVDKTDGSVDGIPEFILEKEYIVPWLELMQKEIKLILANKSDINPYGASNEAEFFAVVSEYFFERPKLFKEKHPELYDLMDKIFR